MDNPAVLDAGAVLAYLQDEAGSELVDGLLKRGDVWMNLVNLGEVTYIVERERGVHAADQLFAELTSDQPVDGRPSLGWVPVDATLVRQAARIKAFGGLSYADAFAAASAELMNGEVVVCSDDEEFRVAERLGIRVRWVPNRPGEVGA